jgi:hypothetical protein
MALAGSGADMIAIVGRPLLDVGATSGGPTVAAGSTGALGKLLSAN